MKSHTYTIVRFIAVLLTILAITGQSHIPKKRLLIHPSNTTNITVDGHIDPNFGDSAKWIDESNFSWLCNIRSEGGLNRQGCGASLSWGKPFAYEKKEAQPAALCTDVSSDEDGDGWGWENEQSCNVATSETVLSARPRFKTMVT